MERLSKEAQEERREYMRIWRAKNRDRTKRYNERYWEKMAKKSDDVKK